jgi:uncharacterized protein (TIGR03437 family)
MPFGGGMMKRWLIVLSCAVAAASAEPKIRTSAGVMNAASYIPLGTAGQGIAQGSFFVIFGTGLGPASIAIAAQPYPNNVGNTSVTVTPVGGSPVQAYLYYALDTQVSGILPSNTPVGDANVTVTYNGVTSAPSRIKVVKSAFGMFTMNQQGSGPAAILNRPPDGTFPLNTLTKPAAGGTIVEVYGTGLGPIAVADNAAPNAAVPAGIDVKVLIGGQTVTPIYAGRTSQYAGEDQIDFQLPPDSALPDGCFVPFAIQVNGVVSNYGTLAKASGATCPAPLGLTAAQLNTLDRGGKINLGLLSLYRNATQVSLGALNLETASEGAGGVFAQFDAAGLYGLTGTPGSLPPLNSPGSCFVQTIQSVSPPSTTIPSVPKALNAGSKLTLAGPNSKSKDMPLDASLGYAALLAQTTGPGAGYLEAGPWSISGAGGPDVGAFTAHATLPTPLVCTNCSSIASIPRDRPLTINWTGGGGAQDYVNIIGTSTAVSVSDINSNVAVVYYCTARASDQTFTVPVSVLSQLPAVSGDPLAQNIGALVVLNGTGANNSFSAPLTAGGNLDAGYFGYVSSVTKIGVGYN